MYRDAVSDAAGSAADREDGRFPRAAQGDGACRNGADGDRREAGVQASFQFGPALVIDGERCRMRRCWMNPIRPLMPSRAAGPSGCALRRWDHSVHGAVLPLGAGSGDAAGSGHVAGGLCRTVYTLDGGSHADDLSGNQDQQREE